MSGPSELSIVAGVLVEVALKATVVLSGGWGVTRVLPGMSAAQRHVVWVVSFAGVAVLPWGSVQRGVTVALDLPWLVPLWAVGVGLALWRWGRSVRELKRLAASSVADPVEPDVAHSASIDGPLTWGLFRPVILFPADAAGWSDVERRAALAHERAHVRRADWAVHTAVWGVAALLWFHPLVWLARRELMREAEHAADDRVLAGGVLPSDYASLLVRLARSRPLRGTLGTGGSEVHRRVHAVLSERARTSRRLGVATAAGVLMAGLVTGLGGRVLWEVAEDQGVGCLPGPEAGQVDSGSVMEWHADGLGLFE